MKRRYPKPKKGAWFIKVRGSYLPCSWQGAITYVPMIAWLIVVMVASFNNANSITHALLLIIPNFVCVGIAMHWLASLKS